MNRRLDWCLPAVILLFAAGATAQGFWDKKEWKKWSASDCKKIQQDSPWAYRWAQSQNQVAFGRTASRTLSGTDDVTLGDDSKLEIWYVIQLRSAEPVREAVVRQQLIQSSYDSLDEKGRAELDQQVERVLGQKQDDVVLVRVYYGSNIPLYTRDLAEYWQGSYPNGVVPADAFLNTASGKKISPIRFISPKSDANEFDLVFPRMVDGQPVASPDSKVFSVEFQSPAIQRVPGGRVLVDFKPAKMLYHGALSY